MSFSEEIDSPSLYNKIYFFVTTIKASRGHDSLIETPLDVSVPSEDTLLSYFKFFSFKPLLNALYVAYACSNQTTVMGGMESEVSKGVQRLAISDNRVSELSLPKKAK